MLAVSADVPSGDAVDSPDDVYASSSDSFLGMSTVGERVAITGSCDGARVVTTVMAVVSAVVNAGSVCVPVSMPDVTGSSPVDGSPVPPDVTGTVLSDVTAVSATVFTVPAVTAFVSVVGFSADVSADDSPVPSDAAKT